MRLARLLAILLSCSPLLLPATFGTVVAAGASYADIVLDQTRSQLYLVNTNTSRIDIYGIKQKTFQAPILTDTQPLSAAMSPDGRYLYVAAYSDSLLDVIDLSSNLVTARISLAANPEGVAVGGDGRVLISTVSVGGSANTLWIYDPSQTTTNLTAVVIAPPAATPPVLPTPTGRVFVSNKSALIATPDGKYIIGSNGTSTSATSTTAKVVFVYEVASGTVLRSRSVANLSQVLSVSPDGSRFMSGSTLFDMQTLQIMAQENAANAPFAFPTTGTTGNFNTQANQGGSIFSPDGTAIYAAFNIAPVGSTSAHTVELLLNDPDNLLIKLGIQLPENLVGKMVIDTAGANIYALSDSGFTTLPIGTLYNSPIVQPNSQVVLLMNDQCMVYAAQNSASDVLNNLGKGKFTASIQTYSGSTTGLGGAGGPGGGVVITLPGFGGVVAPGTGTTTTTTAGPVASVTNSGSGATLNFKFNSAAAANPGTTGPSDFLIQSTEAINIPGNVHVFQNSRSSESQGTIIPVALNASAGEGLTDLLLDTVRQKLYITNSGKNEIEVFDLTQQQFTTPIKVGQLPHGMALGPDGVTLYVANTGGESVSIVDLSKMVQTGRVIFPAVPVNVGFALATPQTIASSGRGPQFVMSDGSLWKIDGSQAIPRSLNPAVFGTGARTVSGGTGTTAFWTMAATPAGEYVLLMTGTGNAYLYDYTVDDFTLNKQVLATPLTGYAGPVTAGPQGKYYSVGGTILNASLTPVAGGTNGSTAAGRPVAAVAAVSATVVAQFTQPVRSTATSAVTDAGMIELYNPTTGTLTGSAATLEGAPSVVTGNSRVSAFARTLAIDPAGAVAYALTASGLSLIPLTSSTNAQNRPAISNGGVVSLADYTPAIASGGLVTIFGRNLGASASGSAPLPTTLGGTCVTLNNQPLPLEYVTSGQINAEIPVGLAAGKYPLVVHSIANSVASSSTTLAIAKYAPAVLIGNGGQAAILHTDGSFVTGDRPASRDERLMVFAIGMGPTQGSAVATGQAAPASPLAAICTETAACAKTVAVYFGPPGDTRSPVIVEWSGLTPGLIGVYQINVYVPGTHISGSAVPVTIKVAGISSSVTGPLPPTVALD